MARNYAPAVPLDPRTPVLVGVGQAQRDDALHSPLDLLVTAARAAGDDTGAGDRLLREAGSVQVPDILGWRPVDPAAMLAAELGASPKETVKSTVGGNSPQMLVNQAALAIQHGDVDVVLLAGVEAMHSRQRARRDNVETGWPRDDGAPPPTRTPGDGRAGTNELEVSRGLVMPTQVYPILECALRAAKGEGVAEHTARIAELWSRFSHVAARNPYAWTREPKSAHEIATPTPDNRMIGFPYPKLMNANMQVDQAAALVLCSVDAARAAGVPEDRWVFPWAGADAADHWWVSERQSLAASPAIAACGRAVFELTGTTVDDVRWIDLYSCFPSAVQLGADALGIDAWDASRVPTLTGGLTFAGGPGNDYVTHSIATCAMRLREDPGSLGLVTALGWYATKHAIGLYSSAPPPGGGFAWRSAQAEVDALPRRQAVDHTGPATVEAYTVLHERDGSRSRGIAALLLDDGRRTWSTTDDAALMAAMVDGDLCGRRAQVAGATFTLG
jgi:acetyl-CoA C-acetyltransferase